MHKIWGTILILAVLSATILPYNTYADSEIEKINRQIQQMEKERKEAANRANQIKRQLSQVQNEKKTVAGDLDQIEAQIGQTAKQLNALDQKIESAKSELAVKAEELQEAADRVEQRDEILKKRIQFMYTNGSVSYLEVLFSSTSFADFIDRFITLETIVDQDKQLLEANRDDLALVATQKAEIENQLSELDKLFAEAEALRGQLLTKEKEKQVMIASLTEKEETLGQIKEEEEEQMIELAAKISALNQKKKVYYTGGKLGWPLPSSTRITSEFGLRKDPFTGKTAGHNGIDIGAPNGTTIVAAEAGEVILAQYVNGYGNTVIIDHGNGLWTVYPHQRNGGISVKKGQVVKRGQKVGEVGSTGRSTGNHLHFEVRLNQQAVNPWNYLR